MLCQPLGDEVIFMVFGPDEQHQVAPCRIVRVQEVRDDLEQAEAAGQDEELILIPQFLEWVRMIIISSTGADVTHAKYFFLEWQRQVQFDHGPDFI